MVREAASWILSASLWLPGQLKIYVYIFLSFCAMHPMCISKVKNDYEGPYTDDE